MSLAFAISCADSPGTGDDDQQQGPTCGDGTCDAAEATSCPTDCGQNNNNNNNSYVCGNGQCETTKGENAQNCGYDCNQGSGSGSGSGSSSACPSDQNACLGCVLDPSQCPTGLDQNACIQCLLNGGLGSGSGSGSGFGSCEGGIPDGTCNAAAGEDSTTCPFDCP